MRERRSRKVRQQPLANLSALSPPRKEVIETASSEVWTALLLGQDILGTGTGVSNMHKEKQTNLPGLLNTESHHPEPLPCRRKTTTAWVPIRYSMRQQGRENQHKQMQLHSQCIFLPSRRR